MFKTVFGLVKGMTNHSIILGWRTPWTEEPGGPVCSIAKSDMTEVIQHICWLVFGKQLKNVKLIILLFFYLMTFSLYCYFIETSVLSRSQWTLQPARLLCPWDFRQEYWSGLSFPPPGYPPNLGIKPHILCLLQCRQILYLLSHQGSHRNF